jgi:hypothetical protein
VGLGTAGTVGTGVAPTEGLALGDEPADALALGVAAVVGEAVGAGVGLAVAFPGLLAGAVGDLPDPPPPPRGNADCFVEAPTAVSTPTVIAKTRTASPATATQRRRRVGSPRRRLVHCSRLQPAGLPVSITSGAGSRAGGMPTADGNGSSGSWMAGSVPAGTGWVGTPPDQSVRRAATARRRSRSFVVRSEARYSVEPTEATQLAIAAPINVPATPNVEEMTAAETAASALAATCVKLGLTGRDGGSDVEETMIGVELLLVLTPFEVISNAGLLLTRGTAFLGVPGHTNTRRPREDHVLRFCGIAAGRRVLGTG